MTKDQIRAIFLAHGFTVKEGQTDLKDYVYAAAEALLSASQPAAPQGQLKRGDMRVIDGVTWHCTDPDIDRWVSNGERSPAAPAQSAAPVAKTDAEALYEAWQTTFDHIDAQRQAAPQQPAQAVELKADISADRQFIAGVKLGWNFRDANDEKGFQSCIEGRAKQIRDALAEQSAAPMAEPEHSAIYISKRLTGSDMDAPLVQAHINQAVSEAMEKAAETCESVAAQSKNSLFRSGAKICACEIRNPTQQCDRAPEGWQCSRVAGHNGPCAASQAPLPRASEKADEAVTEADISACALMIKGICMTRPQDKWVDSIKDRIRFMLAARTKEPQ